MEKERNGIKKLRERKKFKKGLCVFHSHVNAFD